MEDAQKNRISYKRLALGLVLAYVAAVILFYILAGEQLHLRQSRGNLPMPAAESGTVELARGAVIEQAFTTEIQRLQTVNVQWGTYYRPNAGTVTMEEPAGFFSPKAMTRLRSKKGESSRLRRKRRWKGCVEYRCCCESMRTLSPAARRLPL